MGARINLTGKQSAMQHGKPVYCLFEIPFSCIFLGFLRELYTQPVRVVDAYVGVLELSEDALWS